MKAKDLAVASSSVGRLTCSQRLSKSLLGSVGIGANFNRLRFWEVVPGLVQPVAV